MSNQNEKKTGMGSMVLLPLALAPLCCVGILLIGGTGSLGVAAILSWVSAPLVQIGAAGLLGAGLLALWRHRTLRSAAESRTVTETAQERTQLK